MKTGGRKLLRYAAGIMASLVFAGTAYPTTAMASGIGLINTTELLDIHTEADESSAIAGKVMDEGHVAILGRADGWVQIKAGDIIGWIPEANLIETAISNEEAVEANQVKFAEIAERAMETKQEAEPEETEPEESEMAESEMEETESAAAEEMSEQMDTEAAAEEEAAVEAFAEIEENLSDEPVAEIEEEKEAQRIAAEAAQAEAQKAAAETVIHAQAATAAGKQISDEEMYLLANIIYCEAGCEPYIGKVAVANVVLNRVASDKQPNTITEVIYAKKQFSPVANGSLKKALKNGSADESCYQAARDAIGGSRPVGDKLFFRRINGRSGQVIGHHVFY